MAKPLEESPGPEIVIEADESPVMSRLRPRSPLTKQQIDAYRSRRRRTPIWLWATIAAGAMMALILLIVLLLSG